MEKINALLFIKQDGDFSFFEEFVTGNFADFACATCHDRETFITMTLNGYPDIIFIEENPECGIGLYCIESLQAEQIDVRFILLLNEFDEAATEKAIRLGCMNYILKTEDRASIKSKLDFARQKLHVVNKGTRIRFERIAAGEIDELTGALPRSAFLRRLGDGSLKTLVLLNLDDFGPINDAYGVHAGDMVLANTARALQSLLIPESGLFRISGDEFAIIISGRSEAGRGLLIARIREVFARERIRAEALELAISFTIGVATGCDLSVLEKADIALRRAREIGRNRVEEYRHDPELLERQKINLSWAHKISRSIAADGFFPLFQPIVDTRTGEAVMYECLARMLDNGSIVNPSNFIGPARRAGLMPRVTKRIIEKSFEAFAKSRLCFSANICEPDLSERFLVTLIEDLAEKYPGSARRFVLEISEGIQSVSCQADIDQLLALKSIGVKIAFDDFGKGSSNFCRILEIMPDYIKIDGSFIENLDKNGSGYKISRAITEFGKSIDARVIAEYVHSEPVLDKVRMLGVQFSQGYFFGKPDDAISYQPPMNTMYPARNDDIH